MKVSGVKFVKTSQLILAYFIFKLVHIQNNYAVYQNVCFTIAAHYCKPYLNIPISEILST